MREEIMWLRWWQDRYGIRVLNATERWILQRDLQFLMRGKA